MPVHDPADRRRVVGEVVEATPDDALDALGAGPLRRSRHGMRWAVRRGAISSNAPPISMKQNRNSSDGAGSARSRQDAADGAGRSARGRRLPALLRWPGARAVRRRGRAARSDRRGQSADAARPRRLCLHQPVEFSAGDLHRPGRRRAGGGQCCAGQTRRTDPADRRRRHAPAASGGRAGRCAASAAGRRAQASAIRCSPMRGWPASPSPARPKRRRPINRALAAKPRRRSPRWWPRPAGSTR